MTLKIRIQVPKDAGPYEAKVRIGATNNILAPGDEIEAYVYAVSVSPRHLDCDGSF
jgi:hypothetical protein